MFLTPHVAVAVAIAAVLPNPILAIPLAFLSHFVLDMLPHWDDLGLGKLRDRTARIPSHAAQLVVMDGLLAVSFALFFIFFALPDWGVAFSIAACSLAALLPDAYYIPLAFFGRRWGFVLWVVMVQSKLQEKAKAPRAFGVFTQVFAIASGFLIAFQQILIRLPQTWQIL